PSRERRTWPTRSWPRRRGTRRFSNNRSEQAAHTRHQRGACSATPQRAERRVRMNRPCDRAGHSTTGAATAALWYSSETPKRREDVMPDWCECNLLIEGPAARVRALLAHASAVSARDFDFNRFIPYPEKYRRLDEAAAAWDRDPGRTGQRPPDG